jgi:hypothetical protein
MEYIKYEGKNKNKRIALSGKAKDADKGKNEASPDGKPILGHRQEVTGKKARMKPRKER